MKPINTPSNASLSSQRPKPEFIRFHNLKTYYDHQARIIDALCYGAELAGSDRECGEELGQWLSWSVLPAIIFWENVLNNV